MECWCWCWASSLESQQKLLALLYHGSARATGYILYILYYSGKGEHALSTQRTRNNTHKQHCVCESRASASAAGEGRGASASGGTHISSNPTRSEPNRGRGTPTRTQELYAITFHNYV